MVTEEEYISVPEAAKRLGRSITTVSRWCRDGLVPGLQVANKKHYRLPLEFVNQLIASGETPDRSGGITYVFPSRPLRDVEDWQQYKDREGWAKYGRPIEFHGKPAMIADLGLVWR